MIDAGVYLSRRHLLILFGITVCIVSLLPGCETSRSDPNGQTDGSGSLPDTNDVTKRGNGPTMVMSYDKEKSARNPVASFMYFVPLIAPTLVDNISSVNNDQQVDITSHKLVIDSKSFHVVCEFEVLGHGFHMNTFDPAGMIRSHTDELKKGETLKNMLDYIKFDCDGYGIIEVKGTITGSTRTVTEVDMQFSARGLRSPVTIGLYDVKPKDGEYKYKNRSNKQVARVDTLAFRKTEKAPHMKIEVGSVTKSGGSEGFWSRVKGAVANLFVVSPKVDRLGNNTMLEFGYALLQKNPTFTFPKARNIKESKVVETDPVQK